MGCGCGGKKNPVEQTKKAAPGKSVPPAQPFTWPRGNGPAPKAA